MAQHSIQALAAYNFISIMELYLLEKEPHLLTAGTGWSLSHFLCPIFGVMEYRLVRKSNIGLLDMGMYCNDPKFSDRYAWANGVDPNQTY